MFRVTVKGSDGHELCVLACRNFRQSMNFFRWLDVDLPRDTILSFYMKDGSLLRRWWTGREVNLSAS